MGADRGRSHPARSASGTVPSVGLALASGGPLGGIYEVGALIALSDSLAGIDLNELIVHHAGRVLVAAVGREA